MFPMRVTRHFQQPDPAITEGLVALHYQPGFVASFLSMICRSKSIHYRNSIPITSRLHTIIFPLYVHYIPIIYTYIYIHIYMYTFVFLYMLLLLLLYNKFIICVITFVYVHVYTCIIYMYKYVYMYVCYCFIQCIGILHIYTIY